MKFIELFGGIGGFRLGMEKYGHKCIWYNDSDKYCIEIYNKNFNEKYEAKDIRKVDEREIPKHDCICAGFPCQSFSIAGRRKGMEDTRGTLFFEICRIAKFHKPEMLFLENVRGLLSHDEGETFRIILESLWNLGYDVEWQVLNSKNYGVPQNRERVFIIGHLGGFGGRQIFPLREVIMESDKSQKETRKKGTRLRVANTLSARYGKDGSENLIANSLVVGGQGKERNLIQKGYLKTKTLGQRIYNPKGISATISSVGGGFGGKTQLYDTSDIIVHSLQPRSPDRPSLKYSSGGSGHLTREDGKTFCLDSGNSQAVEISPCIRSEHHNTSDVHFISEKSKIRRLTPIECERLQGFTDDFTKGVSDSQRYRQLGNAVTVNVISEIAKVIKNKYY